jgi:hypothetical protein
MKFIFMCFMPSLYSTNLGSPPNSVEKNISSDVEILIGAFLTPMLRMAEKACFDHVSRVDYSE